jgi:hypothetical protein
MNVIRELASFFRHMAGIIFVSQASEPPVPMGVVALWHDGAADRLRFRTARGLTIDLDAVACEHRLEIPAGPTGQVEFTLDYGEEVVDLALHKTGGPGGGAGTVQLVNAETGAPITEAMSINVDAGQVIRPSVIRHPQNLIGAGRALRFLRTRSGSTDESVIAYVKTVRRP